MPTRRNLLAAAAGAVASPLLLPSREARAAAWFWVPSYAQARNLSCEFAACVAAMAAWGTWVSEYQFDDLVGWSENPHWGYRGDINGSWGGTTDYGVYAEPLAWALPSFGFWGDVFYAGGDFSALTWRLDAGYPTVVWTSDLGNTGWTEWTADGTPYLLVPGQHTVVAHGYDDGGVSVMDPQFGQQNYYGWGDFGWRWGVFDGMSMAVRPL